MKKRIYTFMAVFLLAFLLPSCNLTAEEREYYANKENYVTAAGTLTFMNYNEEKTALYLGFSDLTPRFSDDCFQIVGENFLTAEKNRISQKIQIGTRIEFVSATRYFGDGYVMPIVAVSVDGEVLLSFDEGFDNFQEWLKEQQPFMALKA